MKEYVSPTIVDLDITETAEGTFAGSGTFSPETTPIPPIPGGATEDCWINWKCTWTGHNNGGHSVCHVAANHVGSHSGETLKMFFTTNFNIAEVKNASGLTISDVGPRSFTLTRNNHFNPGENIGFNFEIVTSDNMLDAAGNPLHGAIGENNAAAYYCKVSDYICG